MTFIKFAAGAAAVALIAPAALAQSDVFIAGIDVVAEDGTKSNRIEISSFSESFAGSSASSSELNDRSAAIGEMSPVTFTKQIDSSSPALRRAVMTGQVFTEAVIRQGNYKVKLTEVVITSLDAAGNMEQVSIMGRGAQWIYNNGAARADAEFSFIEAR